MFCRQRSTLIRLNFGPKDGEHLRVRESDAAGVCGDAGVHPQGATGNERLEWSPSTLGVIGGHFLKQLIKKMLLHLGIAMQFTRPYQIVFDIESELPGSDLFNFDLWQAHS